MARKGGSKSGKVALAIALTCGGAALVAGFAGSLAVLLQTEGGSEKIKLAALVVPFVVGGLGGVVGWLVGGRIGQRLTDLSLAVSKLGRGGSEVKVRFTGDDEVAALGRSLQYLANDLTEVMKEAEKKGGSLATTDPMVRQLRDKVLPTSLPDFAGYELDAALAAGSRGGLDYYGAHSVEDSLVVFLVSGEGASAIAVLAARMARDELQRALAQGAAPRKALSHANRVMHQNLPSGACAKATLLQLGPTGAKLYQAGARAPMLVCQRGELRQQAAEGLALGLDEGPVFEKSLRPQELPLSPGIRLLLVNEAALRTQSFSDRVLEHTARHTAMFMNMLLGGIEEDAGEGGLREDVVVITAKRTGQS